jgi:hypothetical protein
MESLYVCLFSNGHIKVGRSIDPKSRIATHVDRVACLGVALDTSYVTECANAADFRERVLIDRCAQAAAERFQSEWFAGLDFAEVTKWAYAAAHEDVSLAPKDATRWSKVITELRAVGFTQTAIAAHCGCGQPTVSDLAVGRARDPAYSLGEKLLNLHREHCLSGGVSG